MDMLNILGYAIGITLLATAVLVAIYMCIIYLAKRRESKSAPTPKPEFKCWHTWYPLPWYKEARYDTSAKMLHVKIIKVYVCIHCKETQTEVLYEWSRHVADIDAAEDLTVEILEQYKDKLESKPIVMEMIADMKLVDEESLNAARRLGLIKQEEHNG